ncbi:MAG: polysaccharide deacetylase family protein [Methylobacteriaceae bacterium]|nr:polysaccharide deacetylase family protein [Methylobacteriaceae bacterium]
MSAAGIEAGSTTRKFAATAAHLTRRASHRIARHLPLAPRLMHNSTPLVSFTFDDVPESAYTNGAPMLEAYGGCGTFYVASGLLGQRSDFWTVASADEIADLYRRGHEIALHSHLHRSSSLLDVDEFASDLQRNREALQKIHSGIAARNFAYPFGQCTLARKNQLNSLVRSSRSIYTGVNRGVLDPHYVRATELCDARFTRERLQARLDETQRSRGWLVFCIHDVSDTPSAFGCSRKFLDHALEGAIRRGIRIVTVDAALDLIAGTATKPIPQKKPVFAQELSCG